MVCLIRNSTIFKNIKIRTSEEHVNESLDANDDEQTGTDKAADTAAVILLQKNRITKGRERIVGEALDGGHRIP